MVDAISKYLTQCQSPEFAVRATLFDGLCGPNGLSVRAMSGNLSLRQDSLRLEKNLKLRQKTKELEEQLKIAVL